VSGTRIKLFRSDVVRGAGIVLAALAWSSPPATWAADADTAQPAPPPLLEQLNRETERLYAEVGRGVFRVQLPAARTPAKAAPEESPLTKYKELDPKVRHELEQLRPGTPARRGGAEGEPLARGDAAPPATTRSASDAELKLDPGTAVIVIAPPAQPAPAKAGADFSPDNIGLLLDDDGHLLVPQWVEPDAAAAQPARVRGPGGEVVAARFVGSDRQTNLTVVQLPRPGGTPVRLSDETPREGSLVLLVSPADASGRLGLWAGGREPAAVFAIDGGCLGVSRPGQFLA
jgi:hypothetical protein